MSVAVPRAISALTSTMSSNVQPRPRPSGSGSSSSRTPQVVRSRPAAVATSSSSSSSNNNLITARPAVVSRNSSASVVTNASTTASIAVTTPGNGNKDTSSSAGKVFAKPSKEWVLPERAKPGRKVSAEEPDNKRQSQNRLSQRAHRARRTDYIQTLEERLRAYEADEIHSNVRLQEVARALKADNEKMRKELMAVRGQVEELMVEKEGWDVEKRSMEDMCARLMVVVERLRREIGGGGGEGGARLEGMTMRLDRIEPRSMAMAMVDHRHDPQLSHKGDNSTLLRVSPPTPARRPLLECPICPDPDPDCPCQQGRTQPTSIATAQAAQAQASVSIRSEAAQAASILVTQPQPHHSDCGLCSTTAECLCRAVTENASPPGPGNSTKRITPSVSAPVSGIDVRPSNDSKAKCDVCSALTVCLCEEDDTEMGPVPAVPVAVPLRLRKKAASSGVKLNLWKLDSGIVGKSVSSISTKQKEAECTGDPANCDACRNDTFGQEFCAHLFESSATQGNFKPCADCPGNCMSIQSLLCESSTAGLSGSADLVNQKAAGPAGNDVNAPARGERHETMPPDQAWRTLKAHPNAKFASLALLADVVAGRTKCTGPRVELSPMPSPVPRHATAPGLAQPPQVVPTPAASASSHSHVNLQHTPSSAPISAPTQAVIGIKAPDTDVITAHSADLSIPTPASSPISTIGTGTASKGVKRTLAVETSAVRDALKMLDEARETPPVSLGVGGGAGIQKDDMEEEEVQIKHELLEDDNEPGLEMRIYVNDDEDEDGEAGVRATEVASGRESKRRKVE